MGCCDGTFTASGNFFAVPKPDLELLDKWFGLFLYLRPSQTLLLQPLKNYM